MKWIGLWLLSASWLFGLSYFFKSSPAIAAAHLALGTILIVVGTLRDSVHSSPSVETAGAETGPGRRRAVLLIPILTALAFVPAIGLLSWPERLGPILLAIGCGLTIWPQRARWRETVTRVAGGFSTTGMVLLAQTVALAGYRDFTARSRELPWPLPNLLAELFRLLGANAAADGSDLALSTMRETHRLAATWELLLDPATFCFIVGSLVFLGLRWRSSSRNSLDATSPVSAVNKSADSPSKVAAPRPSGAPGTKLAARSAPGAMQNSPAKTATSPSSQQPFWQRLVSIPHVQALGWLLLAVILWLPARTALHAGVFLHRALRTDYEAPLQLMDQFWSPWPQVILLLPLALLVAYWMKNTVVGFGSIGPGPTAATGRSVVASVSRRPVRVVGLACASVALLTLAALWDPVGQRKSGRIGVDEFHSKWEPTQRPMDTEWYGHLSGYNYACLYDYCTRYYEMSRLTNTLTDAVLAGLDVLIAKVPTEPFQPAEVDAIVRFVERGGGLLLIGEHTDVFNTGYHLNQLARRFGFSYRYDCLFGMESFFDQYYEPKAWRHPALHYIDAFDFATSCSIDAQGPGRGVIVATGLKNSMADYHANNYYPQAVDHASMRAGAFVQLWSTRRGAGRVLAFTDSTIFSNFSAFEPGKAELFLGMLEWLNRQDRFGNPRPILVGLGLLLLATTIFFARQHGTSVQAMVASGTFGWSMICLAIVAYHDRALPAPKPVRPLTWVTIDRTVCDGPLSKGGFIAGKADGFGIFERWILRLGYFIRRASGPAVLDGELAVFFYPTKPVTPEFKAALVRYVEGGGRVLILDSPKNEKSTATGLLEPFGLSEKPLTGSGGTLSVPAGWPAVPVEATHEIVGGQPLIRLDGKAVAAVARRGQGAVVAIGFGSRFSDGSMGVTGDVEPDAKLRQVFDLQFALIRSIVRKEVEGLKAP